MSIQNPVANPFSPSLAEAQVPAQAQAPRMAGVSGGASSGVSGGGMRSWSLSRFLPNISTTSFVFVAAAATGIGLLIRDAFGDQSWLHAIKVGLISAGSEINVFFTETVPALSSTAALASYMGVGAFLASVVNLNIFAQGVLNPQLPMQTHAFNGLKTIFSGAAAGAGWGAMAGTLGAGVGAAPGALVGAGVGAGIGLAQAVIMMLNGTPRA